MKFRVGDVVWVRDRFRPSMTVRFIHEGQIGCDWSDGEDIQSGVFAESDLVSHPSQHGPHDIFDMLESAEAHSGKRLRVH